MNEKYYYKKLSEFVLKFVSNSDTLDYDVIDVEHVLKCLP